MAKGILGKKLGMTQIFDENGTLIPVTIIDVTPNVVLQQKTVESDTYVATKLGFDDKRESLVNKPDKGQFVKAGTTPKRFIKEIRFPEGLDNEMANYTVGDTVACTIFNDGDTVDVTGISKGKGFQGTIVRWNHHTGPMAHGSGYHRGIGSMGPIKGNNKGKQMPGHMGADTVTLQNLKIAKVVADQDIILIRGNVPGAKNSLVVIKTAIKTLK